MKKVIRVLLALALVITCISAVSVQTKAATVASGTCGANGGNLTWSLDKAGTLTISGTGDMCDYYYKYDTPSGSTQPWQNFPNDIKKVVIKDKVTSIGDFAFKGCEKLTSISIPESVTAIGDFAFQYCERLTAISIPDSVISVGKNAFLSAGLPFKTYENGKYIGNSNNPYAVLAEMQNTSSSSCKIHEDTRIISDSVFLGCKNLESVTIPDSVIRIGDHAFSNKEKLTSVTIGNSVVSIGNTAFGWCPNLTSVVIPDSTITIGRDAFRGCESITSLTIGNGVTTIGDEAFEGCKGITSLILPNSLTSIGYRAFASCWNLATASLGDNLTSIGEDAFDGCANLNYSIYDNCKYLGNERNPYFMLWENGNTSLAACEIHPDTKVIGSYAFSYCRRLTSITIPDGVITIGGYAFQNCEGLTSVTIPNSVTTIQRFVFAYCKNLTWVTIPDSVTYIGTSVFSCCDNLNYTVYDNGKYLGNSNNPYHALLETTSTSITSCELHPNTKVIGGGVLYYCTDLKEIAIPSSLITIGDNAFGDCSSLKTVYYAASVEQWNEIYIGSNNLYLINAKLNANCVGLPLFPDVKHNAWYYKAVEFSVAKGYFSGHGNGNFSPTDPITRQDFVVVLSRIAGADLTGYTGETSFTDVSPKAYYAKAIHWATENGIISGYNATTFGVGDKLTREQLVTIMYRYAKKLGVDVTVTTGWDLMSEYPDATAPNPNLREMVAWALEKGIISGKQVNGKTCIAPQASATRAETAQILLNISTKGLVPGI